MKVIVFDKFGGIDVLRMADWEKPDVPPGKIGIRVKAASINPLDWKIRRGEMKLMTGSKFPKKAGIDFSGFVEQCGEGVLKFRKGDEVFGAFDGMKGGAFSEFVVLDASSVWKKPLKLSHSQAASIPVVGAGAYAAIFDLGKVVDGSKVLINGATGGMGMFAVQLAKQSGAYVTAVTSPIGLPFANNWGADEVIDYVRQPKLPEENKYDLIFDLSGKLPFRAAKGYMKPRSVYVNPVTSPVQIISTSLFNLISSQKNKVLLSKPGDRAIQALLTAVDKGLQIEVSRTFPFTKFAEAYRYAEKGGYIGKLTLEW